MKTKWNNFDIRAKELNSKVHEKYRAIEKAAKDTLIKEGITRLYLDGSDREIAEKRLIGAKELLKNAIIEYEISRKEYADYLETHKDVFQVCKQWICTFDEGYDVVESIYKKLKHLE